MRAPVLAPAGLPAPAAPRTSIRPVWLRATHWLNAVAVALTLPSGLRIHNAAPFFDFRTPGEFTMGDLSQLTGCSVFGDMAVSTAPGCISHFYDVGGGLRD